MLHTFDGGPNRFADDRSVQKQPDAGVNGDRKADDDQAVDGNRRSENVGLDQCGSFNRTRHDAPEELDYAYPADQQSERRDHAERGIARVDSQKNKPFDNETHQSRNDRRSRHANQKLPVARPTV